MVSTLLKAMQSTTNAYVDTCLFLTCELMKG